MSKLSIDFVLNKSILSSGNLLALFYLFLGLDWCGSTDNVLNRGRVRNAYCLCQPQQVYQQLLYVRTNSVCLCLQIKRQLRLCVLNSCLCLWIRRRLRLCVLEVNLLCGHISGYPINAQSGSSAFPRHQKEEWWRTNNDKNINENTQGMPPKSRRTSFPRQQKK